MLVLKKIRFLITNLKGDFWNNDYGWVNQKQAEIFTEQERFVLNLPIGGTWYQVG